MVRARVGAAVAVAVLVAVAGGGWVVVQRKADAVLEQAVARVREGIGPGRTFRYASATPSVLHRDARFEGVVLAGPEGTLSAQAAVVRCDAAAVCSGTAEGVKVEGAPDAGVSGTADHVGWTRLEVPAAGDGPSGGVERVFGARFDAAEARGVHLAEDGSGMDVAAVSMADYGMGRRSRGSVEGVSGLATTLNGAIRVRVGHGAFDGADVASLGRIRWVGLPVPFLHGRQTLEMTALDIEQGGAPLLHVGRFGLVSDRPAKGAARQSVDATELRWDGPPALVAGLRGLGYAGFAGEAHVDVSLDYATGELTVAASRVAGEGMGQATLSGGFGHVPADGGAAGGPAAALGVTVRGLDLVLVDAGLVARVFEERAKAAGTDGATLRETVARQVEGVATDSPAAASVRKAVAAFVRAPGTLTVGAHPAAPVSLLEVAQGGGLDGVVGMLNLTAVATK